MMKFYDYAIKNEDGTYGKLLTEDEANVLFTAINQRGMVEVRFTISQVDVENGIIYGTSAYRSTY